MKARLFVVLVLAIGLILLLVWAVTAQEAEIMSDIQPTLYIVSANRTEPLSGRQSAVSLGYTSNITFTPAFTVYLPAAFKSFGGCTTVPTLINPSNGSSLSTIIPLFQWNNGNNPNATDSRLQVAKDSGFTQIVTALYYIGGQGARDFRFSDSFDPATTYYWRVFLMCRDVQGPYSEVWSFTTGSGGTILSAPMLLAPANGSTTPSPQVTFQWSSVEGAVEYLLHWRPVGGGWQSSMWVTGTQTTIFWLDPDTTYEWWVSARNDYAIGDDSEIWQFTTPAGFTSISPQSLDRSFIVESNSATIVFETKDNSW